MTREDLVGRWTAPKRPVLVTEVTRMSKGNYCVAGMDLTTGKMMRPLDPNGYNWRLGTDRSIFEVGHVIDCRPSGKRNEVMPHATEDTRLLGNPTFLERLSEGETYAVIVDAAARSVEEGIGHSLVDNKYVEEGTNCRSLAGLRIERRYLRFHESFGKLRLTLTDAQGSGYDLKVTSDWLQHIFSPSDEEAEPHFGVDEANEWLEVNARNQELVVRVGLARPWDGKENRWQPRRCYLQANGVIAPEDNYHIFAGPPASAGS